MENKATYLEPYPFCGGDAFIRKLYSNYFVDAIHDNNG